MRDRKDFRIQFLEILAADLFTLRQALGLGWPDYEAALRMLLDRLLVDAPANPRVADTIIRLTLDGPAKSLARDWLREANRLAGDLGDEDEWTLKSHSMPSMSTLDAPVCDPALLKEAAFWLLAGIDSGEHEKASRTLEGNGLPVTRSEEPSHHRESEVAPRYLTASTQAQAKVGEIFALIVKIATDALPTSRSFASTPMPEMAGNITINVHGTGIEFVDGSMRSIEVPQNGDSSPVMFTLKTTKPGVHRIEITAWNSSAHIAGLSLWIGVEAGVMNGADEQSAMDMRDPEDGEYTLEIIYDSERNRYRFQLRGESVGVLKPVYTEPLVGTLQTQYQSLLNGLNDQARNLRGLSPVLQRYWLRGLGTLMGEHLVPKEMRRTLWEIRDQIRRLNILCDGDPMPWELLYIPSPSGGDGVFLTEGAGVARWRYGPPPPTRIRALNPHLVHPKGSPPATGREIERLRTLFPNAPTVRDLEGLMELLIRGDFGLLHFASHHHLHADHAGTSFVPFGSSRFDLIYMGNIPHGQYRSTSPLVFMNACTSAGKAPLFTEMSSWADRYLISGAGTFVGSLWEVRDESALEFAFAFYKRLQLGGTLGEAMKDGRDIIGAHAPGDPTRLAYSLYGNPLARLET